MTRGETGAERRTGADTERRNEKNAKRQNGPIATDKHRDTGREKKENEIHRLREMHGIF